MKQEELDMHAQQSEESFSDGQPAAARPLTRHQIREHIFRLIYTLEFCRETEADTQLDLYFNQLPDEEITNPPAAASEQERTYIRTKARAVMERAPEIDRELDEAAHGWRTARMAKADLAILRLAVYEIRYDADIPAGVAINEAVELAKRYGSSASPAFINGVLSRFVKEPAGEAADSAEEPAADEEDAQKQTADSAECPAADESGADA